MTLLMTATLILLLQLPSTDEARVGVGSEQYPLFAGCRKIAYRSISLYRRFNLTP
jgi:hypothetical protein